MLTVFDGHKSHTTIPPNAKHTFHSATLMVKSPSNMSFTREAFDGGDILITATSTLT